MEHPFIPTEILDYCDSNSSPIGHIPDAILATMSEVPRGYMMVGRHVARLLQAITRLKAPRTILEIGTFHGFSAAAIAEVLSPGASLTCCERDPVAAAAARQNLQPYITDHRINLMEMDGIDLLNSNSTRYEMIFIDADKHSFCSQIDLLFNHLTPGGILLVDNAFAGLAVLQNCPLNAWEATTKLFNSTLSCDSRFFVTQLPLRDGITMAIRL